mmetsp:Transcript_95567/g.169701  ORF Transcript_95567/g.169701 Transcript_95567/m.169701 type:complete len:122 (-) Transcript_95567:67-432(-)
MCAYGQQFSPMASPRAAGVIFVLFAVALFFWGCDVGATYECKQEVTAADECKSTCEAANTDGHQWLDDSSSQCKSDQFGESDPDDQPECEGNKNGCAWIGGKCFQCQCRCKSKRQPVAGQR